MKTAEHITLAKPTAWCTRGSPGGATYGYESSSSAFARAISAAALGGGSGAGSPDRAATAGAGCAWTLETRSASRNAAKSVRIGPAIFEEGSWCSTSRELYWKSAPLRVPPADRHLRLRLRAHETGHRVRQGFPVSLGDRHRGRADTVRG